MSKACHVVSIPIPNEQKFIVCVGGNFNRERTEFSRVRVYLADTPRDYSRGLLLAQDVSGGMCSYTNKWALTSSTCIVLGLYHRVLADYLNRNGGL